MHTKILAGLYFIAGYFSCFCMLWTTELHVQSFGVFLAIFLTYQLINELEQ